MNSFEDLQSFATALEVAESVDALEVTALLQQLVSVQEPTYEHRIEMISIHSRGGGTSRKPGNIILNWGRFFDVLPDVGVAAAGFVGENGFVRTLIALYVWNKVWRGSEAELADAEASVIEALWTSGGHHRDVASDEAYHLTNTLRSHRSIATLTRSEFEKAIDVLIKMQCIEVADGEIWLREWVRKST